MPGDDYILEQGEIIESDNEFVENENSSSSSSSSEDDLDEEDLPRHRSKKRKAEKDVIEVPNEAVHNDSKSDEESGPVEPKMKRFCITPKEEENKWQLPGDLVEYFKEYLEKFIPEKDLKDKVLDENPVPANFPKVRKLDEFLFQFLNSHEERLDTSLSKIEGKIWDILGPLSKLWFDLENLNNVPQDGEIELDLHSLLEKTHKSVILLAQAINATMYQRRLYILSAVCKDSFKAKAQLKEKADLFKGHKSLFGSDYRKNVLTLSKEREKAGNMLKAMGLKKSTRPFPKGSHSKEGARSGGSHSTRTVRIKKPDTYEKKHSNEGKFILSRIIRGKFYCTRAPLRKGFSKHSPSSKGSFQSGDPKCRVGRKVKVLYPKLGKSHFRSDHSRDSRRVSNSFHSSSQTRKSDGKSGQGEGDSGRGGDPIYVREGGNQDSSAYKDPIPEQSFSSRKERRWQPSSNKSQKSKLCHPLSTFQDGGPSYAEGSFAGRGLYVQTRSERCLLHSSHAHRFQTVSKISMGEGSLRVPVSVLWPGSSPVNIYQTYEGSCSSAKTVACHFDNLPGRHSSNSPVDFRAYPIKGHSDIFTSEPRFCNKLEEVCLESNPAHRISGNDDRFLETRTIASSRQTRKDNTNMQVNARVTGNNNFGVNKTSRSFECNFTSNIAWASSIKVSSISADSREPAKDLSVSNNIEFQQSHRTGLVGSEFGSLKWEKSNYNPCRVALDNRCLNQGLGSVLGGTEYRGPMVWGGRSNAHQCVGVKSSTASYSDSAETQETKKLALADGQHVRSVLHSKDGGYSEPGHDKIVQADMGSFDICGDHNYCGVPPQPSEQNCRLGVQELSGSKRVETGSTCFSQDFQISRGAGCRSVCLSLIPPASKLHVLETGSREQGSGCPASALEESFRLCLPPLLLIGRVLAKVRSEKYKLVLVAPVWQAQHWYSLLLEMCVQNPILLPSNQDLLRNPKGELHPLGRNQKLQLAAWVVSGNTWLQKEYRKRLLSSSQTQEEQVHYQIMSRPGANGFAGVVRGVPIPLVPL